MYDQEEDRMKMVILMRSLSDGEFPQPEPSHEGILPISKKNFTDIQALKQFCVKAYFEPEKMVNTQK